MARTPFYGRNDTKIAKMDMQAATAPGRAYRDAFENLGKVAADTLEKFREKKEEKDREDNFERMANKLPSEVFSAFGVQSEEEKSDFIKSIKKKGPREDAMAVISFFQKAKDAQEASKLRDLQRQQIRQNLARQKDADQLKEEERMADNQFLQTLPSLITSPQAQRQADIARPGLPALGNADTRNRFLQSQLDDPRNQVPVMNLNDRDFLNQFKDDPQQIKRALAFIEKRKANQPKPMTPQELADYESKLIANETDRIKLNELKNPPVAPIPLTDGEKSRDRKFGEQLVEFNLPDINKGLEQLTEASEALSKSDTLTGPIVSLLPNFVGDRVNPKAAEVREAVEEVVQRNLRLVLGAQFTEKEGERLISRAYNPKLDEAENKKRVERLIKSIQDAAQEKLNMKSYFEKNGTLKGYNSSLPSITSIEQSAFGDSAPASQSILDEIERKKQLRSKRAGL